VTPSTPSVPPPPPAVEPPVANPDVTVLVMADRGKFYRVDANGKKLSKHGYASDAEARAAVL